MSELESITSEGLRPPSTVQSRSHFFIALGEKFSTTTSAQSTSSRTSSRASGTFMSSPKLRLPRFTLEKLAERSPPGVSSLKG